MIIISFKSKRMIRSYFASPTSANSVPADNFAAPSSEGNSMKVQASKSRLVHSI